VSWSLNGFIGHDVLAGTRTLLWKCFVTTASSKWWTCKNFYSLDMPVLTHCRPWESPKDTWIRLYWRPTDHRARILFLTKEYGQRYRYCIPLTALKVLRTDSVLQLCRVNRSDGKLDLWANVKFTCYESESAYTPNLNIG
jgi:hypothetical protein